MTLSTLDILVVMVHSQCQFDTVESTGRRLSMKYCLGQVSLCAWQWIFDCLDYVTLGGKISSPFSGWGSYMTQNVEDQLSVIMKTWSHCSLVLNMIVMWPTIYLLMPWFPFSNGLCVSQIDFRFHSWLCLGI